MFLTITAELPQRISKYEKTTARLNEEIELSVSELKRIIKRHRKIEYIYDDLLIKRDRAKAVGDSINTKKVFCFDGWLPVDSIKK